MKGTYKRNSHQTFTTKHMYQTAQTWGARTLSIFRMFFTSYASLLQSLESLKASEAEALALQIKPLGPKKRHRLPMRSPCQVQSPPLRDDRQNLVQLLTVPRQRFQVLSCVAIRREASACAKRCELFLELHRRHNCVADRIQGDSWDKNGT